MPHEKTVIDCDILVIGAGGVGTGSAARAAWLGLDVTLIEAAEKYGGGTFLAHGASFPGSSTVYKRLGLDDGIDRTVAFWNMLGRGDIKDQEQLRKNVISNGAFLDWFDSLDPSFCRVFEKAEPGFPFPFDLRLRYLNRQSHDESIGPGWTGSWITEKLFETALKHGVRYFNRTRACAFVRESAGKINAVLAKDPGGEVEIHAKAFVLGTGCYLMNDQLMNEIDPDYIKDDAAIFRINVPTNVGDGHMMVKAIGGVVDTSYARTRGPSHHPYSYAVNLFMRNRECVFFDEYGDRFFEPNNENGGAPGVKIVEKEDSPGQKILHSKTGICYLIMDSKQLELFGRRLVDGIHAGRDDYLSKWREDVEYECALEDRPARRADTLRELAIKLGMEPDRLDNSITRYNELCGSKLDEDFGKPPDFMLPIDSAPFYSFMGQNFDNGASLGGVETDAFFRVVDSAGNPFPGLYCAGDCATYSPEDGRGAIGLCGGLGGSWASGYQIANYAAEYINGMALESHRETY